MMNKAFELNGFKCRFKKKNSLYFFQPKKIYDSHFPMLPDEMGGLAVEIVTGGCGARDQNIVTK